MSRNPVASYTSRGGFRMGQVEFKDFLWEALLDPSCGLGMGDTAENLARQYQITRPQVDEYAARSFTRAMKAQESGFLAGEIAAVSSEKFEADGLKNRGIKIKDGISADSHIRPSTPEQLAKIRPGFRRRADRRQLVGHRRWRGGHAGRQRRLRQKTRQTPLARILASAAVGVPPEIMGIGPVPAIRAVLERAGLKLDDIGRFEINEAFGAQVMACARELGLDENKLNVNGGAIAIGHPLGATGIRLALTLARELKASNLRYGIASACIGGGQGIAMLIENTEFKSNGKT